MCKKCHTHIFAAFLVTAFAVSSALADGPPTSNEPLPAGPRSDADGIMAAVRSMLPESPFIIRGRLLTSDRVGRPEPVCMVELSLALGKDPPVARYSVMNLFGEKIEEMTVTRGQGSDPKIAYRKGGLPAPAPAMREPVHGTGITWNDLTLSFLWWSGGYVAGRESVRGRDCVIVEFDDATSTRLWIDNKLFMIIQAEEYDADGSRIRRLSVKNIKKIGDVWMLKDLEVRRYPSMARTLLRVDEVLREGEAPDSGD